MRSPPASCLFKAATCPPQLFMTGELTAAHPLIIGALKTSALAQSMVTKLQLAPLLQVKSCGVAQGDNVLQLTMVFDAVPRARPQTSFSA